MWKFIYMNQQKTKMMLSTPIRMKNYRKIKTLLKNFESINSITEFAKKQKQITAKASAILHNRFYSTQKDYSWQMLKLAGSQREHTLSWKDLDIHHNCLQQHNKVTLNCSLFTTFPCVQYSRFTAYQSRPYYRPLHSRTVPYSLDYRTRLSIRPLPLKGTGTVRLMLCQTLSVWIATCKSCCLHWIQCL